MHEEKCLAHYGILGMHWGIRRTPEELGHAPKKTIGDRLRSSVNQLKEKRHERVANQSVKKRIDISSLSDQELNDVVNRLQLEKRYSDLMRELHPEQKSRARKIVSDLADKSLRTIGDKILTKAINKMFTTREEKEAAAAAKELKKVTTEKAIGDAKAAIEKQKFESDLRVGNIMNLREDYTPAQIQSIKSYIDAVSSLEPSSTRMSQAEVDRLDKWLEERSFYNRGKDKS